MFEIISRAIGGIGDAVAKVLGAVDALDTTEEEKLQLRNELYRIQNQSELELARLGTELAKEQASVIKAEIASDSWLAKTWRPILMLTFGFVIVFAVVSPTFGGPPVDMSGIDGQFWTLVTVGVGGYVGARTIEKITPDVTDAYKHRETRYTEDISGREDRSGMEPTSEPRRRAGR